MTGREATCQEWGESGVESQEVCPACGHYGLFHGLTPCNACSDEQGQRIADAVRAEAGRQTTAHPADQPPYQDVCCAYCQHEAWRHGRSVPDFRSGPCVVHNCDCPTMVRRG